MKNKVLMYIPWNSTEAKADRGFGSAGYENLESYGVQGLCLGKEVEYHSNVVIAFTFIQSIDHENQDWRWNLIVFRHCKWSRDKLLPLVTQNFLSNIRMLGNCLTNAVFERGRHI